MMRPTILVALASFASACGGAQRRPANDEVTTRMTASDEAALSGDGDQRPPLEDVAIAVDRCTTAFDQAISSGNGAAVAACVELFERPACQEAHRRAGAGPGDGFVVTIFEECAREYCPLFDGEQRPPACDNPIGLDASQATTAWLELRAAIWELELELEPVEQTIQVE